MSRIIQFMEVSAANTISTTYGYNTILGVMNLFSKYHRLIGDS